MGSTLHPSLAWGDSHFPKDFCDNKDRYLPLLLLKLDHYRGRHARSWSQWASEVLILWPNACFPKCHLLAATVGSRFLCSPKAQIQDCKHHHWTLSLFPLNPSLFSFWQFHHFASQPHHLLRSPTHSWKLHIFSTMPSLSQICSPATMPQPSMAHPYFNNPLPLTFPKCLFSHDLSRSTCPRVIDFL